MATVNLDFNAVTYVPQTPDFAFSAADVSEDGFIIHNLNGPGGFGNITSALYNLHGAGTPFASYQNVNDGTSGIRITKANSQVWDLKSLQLDSRDIGGGGTVTITGTHADGSSTTAVMFTLDTMNSLQTFTLPETFNDLIKVEIVGPVNFQFDNIAIRTFASLPNDFNHDGGGEMLWYRDNGTVSLWDSGQIGSAHTVGSAVPTDWHIA